MTAQDPTVPTPSDADVPLPTVPHDDVPPAPSPSGDGDRIVISTDELFAPAIDERVQQMRAANAPQMVRPVGAPPTTAPGFKANSVSVALLIAGAIGGLVGWAASELISQQWQLEQSLQEYFECLDVGFDCKINEPWYGDGQVIRSIVFITPFAVILGAVLTGWDGIQARSRAKFWATVRTALPWLIGAGVIGAWIAGALYRSMVNDVSDLDDLHLPRGIAWAFFGAAIGGAIGAASKSSKRITNGLMGGAIGGFVGGFIFDYIELSKENGIPNRLVGLAITGACIGVAIGLVEEARREHWLEIVSGGMAGKQFILYRDMTSVGSAPTCDITLIKDPQVGAQHATLHAVGGALELRTFNPQLPVQVNGVPASQHRLVDGDLVQIGSTVVRYRSKAQATPTLAAPLPMAPPPT